MLELRPGVVLRRVPPSGGLRGSARVSGTPMRRVLLWWPLPAAGTRGAEAGLTPRGMGSGSSRSCGGDDDARVQAMKPLIALAAKARNR